MSSELRVNSSTNRSGLGTITYTDSGPIVSGVGTFANGLTVDGTQTTVKSLKLTGDNYNANWFKTSDKLRFNDNAKATFGTADDLSIYHDGSSSFVSNNNPSNGTLFLQSNANIVLENTNGSNYIKCLPTAQVELYYNGNIKLTTTNTGAVVTGILTATSFVGGLPITSGADNRVITASSASAIQGESSLTYDALELHVNNASPKLKLTDTDNSGVVHLKNVGGAGILTTTDAMIFETAGTERLRIESVGRVIIANGGSGGTADVNADNFVVKNYTSSGSCGISILNADNLNSTLYFGNASDTKRAEVVWSDASNLFLIGTSNANASIKFRTADQSDALLITGQGRIGLNGVVPTSSHTNVNSSIHLASQNTILSRTGDQYFALFQNLKYTAQDAVRYLVNGYASAYAQNAGTHRFYTVGNGTGNTNATVTERLKIDNNGLVLVNRDGVGGRIDATAGDASIKISDGNGRSSLKVSDPGSGNSYTWELTSAGNFKAPAGKGIDFSATSDANGTMASELFADYERGTHSFSVTSSSTNPTVNISSNHSKLYYTKIGDMVHVTGELRWTISSHGTGHLRISLPFTSESTANSNSQGTAQTWNVNWRYGRSNAQYLLSEVLPGTNYMIFRVAESDTLNEDYLSCGSNYQKTANSGYGVEYQVSIWYRTG